MNRKSNIILALTDQGLVFNWRASEVSETVLWVDNAKSGICYMYSMYGWYEYPLNTRAGNFFLQKTRFFRLDHSLF